MYGTAGERVDPMLNPPHLGELVCDSMNDGWNVSETAARPGCERRTLSRLLTCAIAVFLCAPAGMRAQAVCPTPWQLEEVLRIGSLESTACRASWILRSGPTAPSTSLRPWCLRSRSSLSMGRCCAGSVVRAGARGYTACGPRGRLDRRHALGSRLQPDPVVHADERRPEQIIQFSRSVPEEGSSLFPGRMLADGTLVGRRLTTDGRALSSRGENPGLALRRLSRSGEVLDTIATVEWPGNAIENERDPGLFPGRHPLRDLPPIGLGEYLTAFTSDGSAVRIGDVHEDGTPPTFDLLVISIRGDTLLNRSVEYEPREVTRAMESRLADEYAGRRAGDHRPSSPIFERTYRAARGVFWVPEYLPPIRQVVAGTDGTIWLLHA